MKSSTKITSILLCTSLLTACQQGSSYDQNPNTYKGAGMGAIIGGAAGAMTGDNERDRWTRGAIGAGIGTVAGGAIGQYMDRQENAMREELQGSGVDVRRDGDDILLNMPNSITFGFNSSVVRQEFNRTLTNVANVLNQYPNTRVEVIGHTDNIGTNEYNQALSVQRAQAVGSRLVNYGVVSDRLYIMGYGETQPLESNDSEVGRAENRRVEIRISPNAQ